MRDIGFTGTQGVPTGNQLRRLVEWLADNTRPGDRWHHGDCIGADEFSHVAAHALGLTIAIHPCDIESKRAFCEARYAIVYPVRRPLERNQIIAASTSELVALPKTQDEELRSGTWATVRYARKLGKRVTVIGPESTYILEGPQRPIRGVINGPFG